MYFALTHATMHSTPQQKEGIIFEPIGTIQADNDVWTLIRQVELTPLLQGSHHLHEQLTLLQANLSTHLLGPVAIELSTLAEKMTLVDTKLQQAQALITTPRSKRGMIDAAGYALRWLTGTATMDDINQISTKAGKLRQTQIDMEHHLLDQLSILNATTITAEENSKKIKQITTAMGTMAAAVDSLQVTERQADRVNAAFRALSSAIHTLELCTLSIMNDLSQFLEAFELLYTNHISSYFLPPRELIHIFRDLQKQLPPHLDLPFDLSTTGMYHFYQLARTKAALSPSQQLLLFITIPLRNEQKIFELYQLHEAPIAAHIGTFKYLHITEPYFAVTSNHKEYLLLSESQRANCRSMEEDMQLCHIRQVTSMHSPSCVSALFLDDTIAAEKLCQYHIVAAPLSVITPLKEKNSWFYFTSESTKVDWSCPKNIKLSDLPQFIHQSGTLHVPPRCTAEIQDRILYGIYSGTQAINLPQTLQKLPILQPLLHKQFFDQVKTSNDTSKLIHQLLTHPVETSKNLKTKIKINNMDAEIKQTLKSIESDQVISTHAVALYSGTGISLGIALVLLIIAWYLRGKLMKIAQKWTPRKTRIATPQKSDSILETHRPQLRRAQSVDTCFDIPLQRSVHFDYEPPRLTTHDDFSLPRPPPLPQEEKTFLDKAIVTPNI